MKMDFMLTYRKESFEGLALGARIASLNWPRKACQPWLMSLAYGCTYVHPGTPLQKTLANLVQDPNWTSHRSGDSYSVQSQFGSRSSRRGHDECHLSRSSHLCLAGRAPVRRLSKRRELARASGEKESYCLSSGLWWCILHELGGGLGLDIQRVFRTALP